MDSNDMYYEAGSADAEPSENGELLSPFLTPPTRFGDFWTHFRVQLNPKQALLLVRRRPLRALRMGAPPQQLQLRTVRFWSIDTSATRFGGLFCSFG